MTRYNPSSKHPIRAVQAWMILVGAAMNRQTLTYQGLSQKMYGKSASGVLDKILGHVAFYCEDNELPPLTGYRRREGPRDAWCRYPCRFLKDGQGAGARVCARLVRRLPTNP